MPKPGSTCVSTTATSTGQSTILQKHVQQPHPKAKQGIPSLFLSFSLTLSLCVFVCSDPFMCHTSPPPLKVSVWRRPLFDQRLGNFSNLDIDRWMVAEPRTVPKSELLLILEKEKTSLTPHTPHTPHKYLRTVPPLRRGIKALNGKKHKAKHIQV